MKIFLLTDIPVWVRPLERKLAAGGAKVLVGSDPSHGSDADLVVNRLSTRLLRISDQRRRAIFAALRRWESTGKCVINGLRCLEIGLSKLLQFEHFKACSVRTPDTRRAIPGGRALPGRPVLLKPPAGGFGRGIRRLAAAEPTPHELRPSIEWVEQDIIHPSDGLVHRVELIGDRILYDATTPLDPEIFDYCLAHSGDRTDLTPGEKIDPSIANAVKTIAAQASMHLGAMEYFLDPDNTPVFFDLNPVSSLHPAAADFLGDDPLGITADFLLNDSKCCKQ